MSNLTVDTSIDYQGGDFEQEQLCQQLMAQRAAIDAQLAAIQKPSQQSTFTHHRSPIHKNSQQRRNHVPRSMSNAGVHDMSRNLSDGNNMSQRSKSNSQRSNTKMSRTDSRGSASQKHNVPFTQNGAVPPLLNTELRQDNPAIMDWASQDQPLNAYTFSHQPAHLQIPQRNGLEQVPELASVGEDPADFIMRKMGNGFPPSIPIPSSSAIHNHRLSASSYNLQAPSTPTTDSLTNATTLTSDMSRQNSLCNAVESMKFNMNNSFPTDSYNDHYMYDHLDPLSSSRYSHCSSNEDQSQLLAGAGASHASQFSLPLQFSSSNLGEKMEKSQSVESNSSSTSSSRNVKRLQDHIQNSSRPIMPKGGSGGTGMSRDNSSQAMARSESKDGLQDKLAISKPSYQRPKHERVYCTECENHPDGFRGEHELRRHVDREHKPMVKKWVCIEPTDGGKHPQPIVPLSRCKACSQQKKKYGAYYNAAAHLRRAHFNPKQKGRSKSQQKVDDSDKRGGKAGGDDPPMPELKKHWMKEVEERADNIDDPQQEAADESEAEEFDNAFDDQLYSQPMNSNISNISNPNNFDSFNFNESVDQYHNNLNTEFVDMQDMSLVYPGCQQDYMAQAMYSMANQKNISIIPADIYQNDSVPFPHTVPIPHQGFDDLTSQDLVWNM